MNFNGLTTFCKKNIVIGLFEITQISKICNELTLGKHKREELSSKRSIKV